MIADDTSYINEPFFQDDVVAQAVDRAQAAGVASSPPPATTAAQSWEGTFNGAPGREDFDPGPASTRSRRWAAAGERRARRRAAVGRALGAARGRLSHSRRLRTSGALRRSPAARQRQPRDRPPGGGRAGPRQPALPRTLRDRDPARVGAAAAAPLHEVHRLHRTVAACRSNARRARARSAPTPPRRAAR